MRKQTVLLIILMVSLVQVYGQTKIRYYTSKGEILAQIREDLVPITGENKLKLVRQKFYDKTIYHRVIKNFMMQGGCPDGTGMGGAGWTIKDEFHPDLLHDSAGVLSMANAGPNTGSSQYFITFKATKWLDNKHAVFGYVLEGMDVVMAIGDVQTQNDKPIEDVRCDSIRIVPPTPIFTQNGALLQSKPSVVVKNNLVMFPKIQNYNTSLQLFSPKGQLLYVIPNVNKSTKLNLNQYSKGNFILMLNNGNGVYKELIQKK